VLLHADHLRLLAGKSILKSISEDENKREGLSELVRALRGSGSLSQMKCKFFDI
jgi:hypothetical protein